MAKKKSFKKYKNGKKYPNGLQPMEVPPKVGAGEYIGNTVGMGQTGMQLGKVAGPKGAAIGAAVGIGVGLGKSYIDAQEAKQQRRIAQDFNNKLDRFSPLQGLNDFTMPMQARNGMNKDQGELVEVEKGELVLRESNGRYHIVADFKNGKRHEDGGEPFVSQPDDIIVSSKLAKGLKQYFNGTVSRGSDYSKIRSIVNKLPKDYSSAMKNGKKYPNGVGDVPTIPFQGQGQMNPYLRADMQNQFAGDLAKGDQFQFPYIQTTDVIDFGLPAFLQKDFRVPPSNPEELEMSKMKKPWDNMGAPRVQPPKEIRQDLKYSQMKRPDLSMAPPASAPVPEIPYPELMSENASNDGALLENTFTDKNMATAARLANIANLTARSLQPAEKVTRRNFTPEQVQFDPSIYNPIRRGIEEGRAIGQARVEDSVGTRGQQLGRLRAIDENVRKRGEDLAARMIGDQLNITNQNIQARNQAALQNIQMQTQFDQADAQNRAAQASYRDQLAKDLNLMGDADLKTIQRKEDLEVYYAKNNEKLEHLKQMDALNLALRETKNYRTNPEFIRVLNEQGPKYALQWLNENRSELVLLKQQDPLLLDKLQEESNQQDATEYGFGTEY